MAKNLAGHTHPANFGKEVDGCSRCKELANGAPATAGWGRSRSQKAADERMALAAIRAHDCKKSRCSYICTFGEW